MAKSITKIKPAMIQVLLIICLVSACQAGPLVVDKPDPLTIEDIPPGMSQAEVDTLSSLEQIDNFPLYTMAYSADYDHQAAGFFPEFATNFQEPSWGCSLFAVYGDQEEMLFGRNFDWDFSPALLLFTYPQDGYASVSIVDIAYLGYGDDNAFGLTGSPLSERIGLLDAPYFPFDGMNEAGLAVGMASVPPGEMADDPNKETSDSLMVIRKMLDQAATVDEAIAILGSYNIDMGSGPPLHYLIAEGAGRSALVEFSRGEMVVIFNNDPWQLATNFLVSEAGTSPEDQCWRYGLISRQLSENEGSLSSSQAMELLEDVAQENTQWSVVYGMSSMEISITMGREFDQVHSFNMGPGD